MRSNRTSYGFTVIELMVVLMIAVILVLLAAPSFQGVLDRQRVRSMTSNLATDIQYARSQAVGKNATLTVTFSAGTWCYGYSDPLAPSPICNCTLTVETNAEYCKVKRVTSDDFPNTTMTLTGGNGFSIDPRQGGVSAVAGGAYGAVTTAVDFASTTTTSAQLRTTINSLGRVLQCAPSGSSVTGYPAC